MLNKSADTVYVVNFWATWCKPCVRELPYFEELCKKTHSIPLKVLLVSSDLKSNITSRLKPFIAVKGITNKVVLLDDGDANSWINKIDSNWNGAISANVIIKNGKPHFFEKEYHSTQEIEKDIRNIKHEN